MNYKQSFCICGQPKLSNRPSCDTCYAAMVQKRVDKERAKKVRAALTRKYREKAEQK